MDLSIPHPMATSDQVWSMDPADGSNDASLKNCEDILTDSQQKDLKF